MRRIKLRPMSSICFSPNSFSSHPLLALLFSSFCLFHAVPFSSGSRGFMAPRTENALRVPLSFFVFLKKTPRRTCKVLSRSCRRILDTTRLGMFSRDHPIPRSLRLFGGYAMHYAIPCVSRELLNRFSLAFCTYPWCFTRWDDCIDKTRVTYVCMRVLSV